jgi:hypothetical protein
LWESDLNKNKTIALWQKIAQHYANESFIGGYDLLNEPNWTFEGKNKNGIHDISNKDIWDLYIEITKAIRQVDKNNIIYIEGNGWANNFNGIPDKWDDNMVLSFHKYWNPNSQESINGFIALGQKHNLPLWLGESGENSNKWFTDCIELVEKNRIGWAWWPLKKITSIVNPLTIIAPDGYESLLNYWKTGENRPTKEFASNVLFELTENLKAGNCIFQKGIIDAMFRQVTDTSTLPYTENAVPGKVFAVDYDLGRLGYAYYDNDNERIIIENQQRTASNKGGAYRNDGVDIVNCTDIPEHSKGFVVSHIESGEWLKYTLNVLADGKYTIRMRLKPTKNKGKIQIEFSDSNQKLTVNVPKSRKTSWQTLKCGSVK